MSEPIESIIIASVNKTFYTPESIEAGGEMSRVEEVYINEAFEMGELVDYIKRKGFHYGSESHGVPRWIETVAETTNHETGESMVLSLHPALDAQSQALWEQALIEAEFPMPEATLPTRGMKP